ncbi:LysM peptidoglycan-binding domain-containing protein [Pseudonocardia sp. Cha107L01]|jgi:LysM repeat protein|uniref:LysM peptidoglycan-binding domain-containing protein n=1 Tax=Pseudonocardia sp. Cha107L01 TaxID=3457576 RepID=UPI00403E6F2E
MTRSRGTSRARSFGSRNLARVVVAGIVVAGTPLVLAGTANAAPDDVWDQIAKCESGGRWNTSTGNGYSGGLQFSPSTWRAYGGSGSASGASRAQQIAVAERVLAAQGWGAWPSCSRKVGARGKASARTVSQQTSATKTAKTQVKPNAPVAKPNAPVLAAAPATPAKPGVVTPAAPATPAKPGAKYTVVPGDSLSKIAQTRNIPGGWQALYDHNKAVVSNPSLIKAGQQLDLG